MRYSQCLYLGGIYLTTDTKGVRFPGMGRVQVWAWVCERCDHWWVPRVRDTDKEPRVCPKCKSPYWNVPRKPKGQKKA